MSKPRTGTVYYRARQKLWGGSVSLGGGKRRWFYAKTEEAVREKMVGLPGVDLPPVGERRPPRADYRVRAVELALRVLQRARLLGWAEEYTARVMAVALSRSRVVALVSGPCVYCGTELADSVDHAIPFARGGEDVPSNVVSACQSCNLAKNRKTPDEWLPAAR